VAVSWDVTLATSSLDTHGYVKQMGLVSLIPECLSGPSCKLVNLYRPMYVFLQCTYKIFYVCIYVDVLYLGFCRAHYKNLLKLCEQCLSSVC